MENLTHSLSKKSYSGNGFGMTSHHKSVYDDVFGGPPKFGVPTLAPRFEDYNEIFGGFHSSRGSSIPILDLPVLEDVELLFDVRSSRLDYYEVFGGFGGLDFSVSFEDLVKKSNGGDDSSEDAWSPAQSNCPSDETDPSACSERSQSLLNADAHHLSDDVRQFNVLYHKVNQKTSDNLSNRAAHIDHVHAIPGHAYLMNDTRASMIVENEGPQLRASDDLRPNTELLGRRVEERRFKKSISLPTNNGSRAPGSVPNLARSSRSSFTEKKPFVTVSDISLKTRPSRLPPPSRPPPAFALEKGEPQKLNSKLRATNSYAFERRSGENSPPFYDVEIDASSSKLASVVALEKAQANIRHVKESVEKDEVLQSHAKSQAQDTNRTMEPKINEPVNGDHSCGDDKPGGVFARGGNGMQPSPHERQNVIQMSQEISDMLDDEKYIDLVEKSVNRRHGKESSSQVSHKPEGTFAWRRETEYFEVVETDISLEVVEQDNDDKSSVFQNKEGPEEYRHGIKPATGASQQQEVIKEVKAFEEAPKLVEKSNQLEMWEDACGLGKNWERSDKPIEPKENPKNVKVDVTSYASEMSTKKLKRSKQYAQEDADENAEMLATIDQNVAEVEVRYDPDNICEKTDSYKENNVHAKNTACDTNLEEAVEQVDDIKWEIQQEVRKKQESCKKEENKKKEKEACEVKNNGSIVEEQGECEAIRHDESENNLRTCEQADKGRHKTPDCETEETKETVLETHKLVENEQYEVSYETGEPNARLTEVWKQEPEKHGATVIPGDEDTEVRSRLTSALKGSVDRSQNAFKHDELAEQTEDADQIKWDKDEEVVILDQGIHDPAEGDIISSFNGMFKFSDKMHETPETAQAAGTTFEEDKKSKPKFENNEQEIDIRAPMICSEEISMSFGKNQNECETDKIQVKDDTRLPSLHELAKDSDGAGIGITNPAKKQGKKVSPVACDPEKIRVSSHEKGQGGKISNEFKMTFSEEPTEEKSTMHQVFTERTESGIKIGAASFTVLDDKKNTLNTHQRGTNQNVGTKQKQVNMVFAPEDRKIEEKLHHEKEQEKEYLRKLEEEREREREREKDRMPVDRVTLEVRERSYAEARDRAERTVFGRATTEVRQRAAMETRGRLDKESMEARLRVERAAVERATAEARQRAFERAMSDKTSFEARERFERSVPDKFCASSRNAEMRQIPSSDLSDLQSHSSGTSNSMRSSYYNAGAESESPQRNKARLERYRRTAERAAKALAEKNMRDLLAQREQAERSRLAETLDAEVRRWSSGKEGNLRALLSTLQYILGPDSGWHPVPLTEVITSAAVKKAYRKATLCVHPDKLQQRGASIQQKYVCEKVFDLLKEAWNTFNSEER